MGTIAAAGGAAWLARVRLLRASSRPRGCSHAVPDQTAPRGSPLNCEDSIAGWPRFESATERLRPACCERAGCGGRAAGSITTQMQRRPENH
jgi:hypothetical protein